MLTAVLFAADATASDIALNGNMSLVSDSFVTALCYGLAVVLGAAGVAAWNRRKSAKQRPLDSGDLYVRCAECAEHRAALSKRIDELGPALNRIFKKLSENDTKSEERTERLHRRIDPLIDKLAETKGRVDSLESQVNSARTP